MNPRIELLAPKKLLGKSMRMSLMNNQTQTLWQSFMIRKKEIVNVAGSDLYSMQVYNQLLDLENFNPQLEFTKWAAIEVKDYSNIPKGMEIFELSGGLYAVFIHKGPASDFKNTFQFIFSQWLPQSDYDLDDREHFELLGEKYKNNHPDSEEEVWVPVKLKMSTPKR